MRRIYLALILIICTAIAAGACAPARPGYPAPTMEGATPSPSALTAEPSATPEVTARPLDMENAMLLRVVNVGKADCLIFRFPNGEAFMVDTGLKDTADAVLGALEDAGIEKLTGIIITHGHKDHIGGLKKLWAELPVEAVYTNPLDTATFSKKERRLIAESGAQDIALRVGDELKMGGGKAVVLSPNRFYSEEEDENNNSLVLLLTFGSCRFLLMGDATLTIEHELVESGVNVSADFLKAGRHGKDDATSERFLKAVSPSHAALTGNRSEDNEAPSARVIRLMGEYGVQWCVNEGENLAVDFYCDGVSIQTAPAQ